MAGLHGGADADEEDFAHERGDGRHEWLDAGGKLFARRLEALLHEGAGAVEVGVPVELGVDEGEGDVGVGTKTGDASDAEQGGLEGLGDARLNFFGCEAGGFGEDDDGGLGEIGEDLDREAQAGVGAEREQ